VQKLPYHRGSREVQAGQFDLPEFVPIDFLADLLGLTTRGIRALAQRGAIPGPHDARWPVRACVQAYVRHWKEWTHKGERTGEQEERVRLLRAKRELAEFKVAQMRARLVDKAEAERQAFEVARAVRDSFLNWPARVAATVAARIGHKDAVGLQLALEDEVRGCLEALAAAVRDGDAKSESVPSIP